MGRPCPPAPPDRSGNRVIALGRLPRQPLSTWHTEQAGGSRNGPGPRRADHRFQTTGLVVEGRIPLSRRSGFFAGVCTPSKWEVDGT